MSKLTVKKGYTLEVVSWENDGDNYKTKYYTYPTEEYAKLIKKMCLELFASVNSSEVGIGNMFDDEGYEDRILSYLEENDGLVEGKTDQEMIDIVMAINYALLGGSDCYYSRVCESVTITYSPEDIYTEEIK